MDTEGLLREKNSETLMEPPMAEQAAPIQEAESVIEQAEHRSMEVQVVDKMAGLPTRDGILSMMRTGSNTDVGLDKLHKHKKFAAVINAIERYQELMNTQVDLTYGGNNRIDNYYKGGLKDNSEERRNNFFKKTEHEQCVAALQDIITSCKSAISSQSGLFGALERRSSTVRNLTPVIAQVLVQAYAIAPKVTGLRDAITSYSIENSKDIFSFAEVLSGRSAGVLGDNLVSTGVDNVADVSLKRDAIDKAMNNHSDLSAKEAMGREQLKENLRNKVIPIIPTGIIKIEDYIGTGKLPPSWETEKREEHGKKLDAYLDALDALQVNFNRHLKEIQFALDQLAEAEGLSGNRLAVKENKAKYMPLSRLIGRVLADQEAIAEALESGRTMPGTPLRFFREYEGLTLDTAVEVARLAYESDVIEFDRKDRKALGEKDADYKKMGGGFNTTILDYRTKDSESNKEPDFLKEGRVFRFSHREDESGNNHKQDINGMYDEAVGLVSRFFGWDVAAQSLAAVQRDQEGILRYGGSVMELAKNRKIANDFDFTTPNKRVDKPTERQTLDITNGDFLRNFQQMVIMDYICFHEDRSGANYMIDMNAKGSKIKAIDNDIVFGEGSIGEVGGKTDIAALASINERKWRTHGTQLTSGLHRMSPENKQAVLSADLGALDRLLMPYVQQVTRNAAIHRLREVQEYAASVPDVDFTSREDCEKFVMDNAFVGMKDVMKNNSDLTVMGSVPNLTGNGLTYNTSIKYAKYNFASETAVIEIHTAIQYGFTREETLEILEANPSFEKHKESSLKLLNDMYNDVEQNPEMKYAEYAGKYGLSKA